MNVKKQNLTKEDFYFDTAGTGEKVNVYNSDGTVREATKINASHIPILLALRSKLGGVADINSALAYLQENISQSGQDASTTKKGIVELATGAEVIAGTNAILAVSPLALKSLTSTLTRIGLIQLASNTEALAGTDPNKAITPARLKEVLDNALSTLAANSIEYGMIISNNADDAENDIDISIGQKFDSTHAYNIKLSSVFTKRLDANWIAGSGNGGRASTVALSADTWYYVFALYDPTTDTVDFGFDTSITAANLLSDATGYTKYKLIGKVRTDDSTNILAFDAVELAGGGVDYTFKSTIQSLSSSSVAAYASVSLHVPPGAGVTAKCLFGKYTASGVGSNALFREKGVTSDQLKIASGIGGSWNYLQANIRTNESSQIEWSQTGGANAVTIDVFGWIDERR